MNAKKIISLVFTALMILFVMLMAVSCNEFQTIDDEPKKKTETTLKNDGKYDGETTIVGFPSWLENTTENNTTIPVEKLEITNEGID